MRDQRGAFEGPLVVQPRRQRFPLVDERSAGVHPGLPVPVAHRARVVAGCDHDVIDARCAARRRHGHRAQPAGARTRPRRPRVGRAGSQEASASADASHTPPTPCAGTVAWTTPSPASNQRPVQRSYAVRSPDTATGTIASVVDRLTRAVTRSDGEVNVEPKTPAAHTDSTEMYQGRPVTVDEQVVQRPLRLGHPAQGLGVAIGPAHPDAEDDLPDHDTHPVEPRRLELLGVVAVPAAHVVHLVPPLEPVRADDARCRRVGEPLRPRQRMVGQPLEREGRLALDRYSGTRGGQPVEQLGPTLLEGVEEDPVDLELGDQSGQLGRVVAGPPGAGVPRVVVDEHLDPGRVQVGDKLGEAVDVAVEVPLVPVVEADHGVRVPQHHSVEPAEPLPRVGEQPVGREPVRVPVVEQLVPQPHLADDVAPRGPGHVGPVVEACRRSPAGRGPRPASGRAAPASAASRPGRRGRRGSCRRRAPRGPRPGRAAPREAGPAGAGPVGRNRQPCVPP